MSRPFRHCIEVLGITLNVSGIYETSEPDRPDEKGCDSTVEVERITAHDSSIDIKDLICADTIESIENKIDRIEGGN